MHTDLELLEMRAEHLGPRLADWRGVRLLRTRSDEAFHVGSGVPPDLTEALTTAHRNASVASEPALDACAQLLQSAGWDVHRNASLVWLIEPGTAFTTDASILRSDEPLPDWMRHANPGNWHPIEWIELLEGDLGPWAMATRDERILSICHTPVRMTDDSAECGVWTDPDFRGRGYAAAATAAWADVLRDTNRHLFYSTDPDNHASCRVAERLSLRLLGRHWSLCEPEASTGGQLHPLSRVRSDDNVIAFGKPPKPDEVVAVFGGLVDEAGITFALYGEDLEPDEITALLGVAPTRSFRKGERRRRSPPHRHGAWFLEERGKPPIGPEWIITRLLARLPAPDSPVWRDLRTRFDFQLRFVIYVESWNRGFRLPGPLIAQLGQLGCSFEFDIYADGDDED